MKKLLTLTLALCLMAPLASAEVYIITEKGSGEIYSMSNEDDAVMPPSGYEKHILPGTFANYPLEYPSTYYKYKNNCD